MEPGPTLGKVWKKRIKTAKLSSPPLFPLAPDSGRFILESDRRPMESLHFPDYKLAPRALIESFSTSSFFLHGLLGRLLLL